MNSFSFSFFQGTVTVSYIADWSTDTILYGKYNNRVII